MKYKMNKSEIIAWEYLKEKDIELIDNTGKGTPDFLGENKNYEVKKLYVNKLIFTEKQLKKTEVNCSILVVDNGKVMSDLPLNKIKKKFKIVILPECTGIKVQLERDVVNRLIEMKEVGDTYSDVIRRLIKNV